MNNAIAFCGIACSECDAFLSTQTDDNEKREKTARMWSKMFKTSIKPGDINCDGCRAESGIQFSHCKVCEIRNCAIGKNHTSCGICDEYPCPKLDFIFGAEPNAKKRLDEIRG